MLKNEKDFNNLFKKRTLFYSSFYIVYFIDNSLKHSRLGISISKKNQKLAVLRNKAKRQIKSILNNELFLGLKKDVLIVVKKEFFDSDFETKKTTLLKLVNKINHVKNKN